MKKAIDVYHSFLVHPTIGESAREYLKSRGLNEHHIDKYQLGYSPDDWQNLSELSNNYQNKKLLIDAGLLIEKENGHSYARFRNRVMFPIHDRVGRPIAFGARTLGDDKPKYLNSPETPIFKKSNELYHISIARNTASDYLIVTEGYMDAITPCIFGIDNCCASLGTAINEEQIERLFYINSNIVFCFDGDKAGKEAAKSALEKVLCSQLDINAKFLILPDNHDLDSYLHQFGVDKFQSICDLSPNQFEFLNIVLQKKFEPTIIGEALSRHYQSTLRP